MHVLATGLARGETTKAQGRHGCVKVEDMLLRPHWGNEISSCVGGVTVLALLSCALWTCDAMCLLWGRFPASGRLHSVPHGEFVSLRCRMVYCGHGLALPFHSRVLKGYRPGFFCFKGYTLTEED